MKQRLLLLLGLLVALPAAAADGLTTLNSRFDVSTTEQRLVDAVEGAGMNVFARIDHAAGADRAGLALGPTHLVIFGNPKVGTKLMQCRRSAAIDLPMKMLVWEEQGTTHIGYNSALYLASRHAIAGCDEVLAKVAGALDKFARQAGGK